VNEDRALFLPQPDPDPDHDQPGKEQREEELSNPDLKSGSTTKD